MHLVFLNQYYPPDAAPTGVMLEGLVDGLLRDGHEVSVLCAAGGYAGKTQETRQEEEATEGKTNIEHRTSNVEHRTKEDCGNEQRRCAQAPETTRLNSPLTIDESSSSLASCVLQSCVSSSTHHRQPSTLPRLRIIRIGASKFGRGTFAGKLLDYASYYLGASWKLLTMRPQPDRIVALTTPPYLSLLARAISKLRGADHAHWVMDVYPDVLAAHGMLSEQSLAYRLLAVLARWGMGGIRCAAILTLGPDMAERVGGGRGVGGSLSEKTLKDKTQDKKTQDAREEEEVETNIEHRTEEACGNEPGHGTQAPPRTRPNSPKVTDDSSSSLASCALQSCVSSSTVTWVPLWGTGATEKTRKEKIQDKKAQDTREEEEANIEHRTSNIERRTKEDCESVLLHGTQAPPTTRLKTPGTSDYSSSSLASCVLQSCVSSSQPTTLSHALAMRRARGWGDAELVVMYSGNMGLGHRFGEILAVAGGGGRSVGAQMREKTQDEKTQDTEQEEEANIEHRTSNIERRTKEDCESVLLHGTQAPPTTRLKTPGTSDYSSSSLASCVLPSCVLPSCVLPSSTNRQPTTLPLRFVFFGGGKRRDEVAKFAETHPAAGIELHDYAPADQLLAHLQSADVHIASLEPAWSGTMVPSKLQGIFAAARPVIFIGSADSSIGRWVQESGGGWVVSAGDVGGLLEALEQASDPDERARRGRAALAFAEEHFDQHRNVARVAAILTV